MASTSPTLALPYLIPSQAQKHVTHNEALRRLDTLTQLVVEDFDALTPPALPTAGAAWALGPAASDAWSGHDGDIATWTGDAWSFVAPKDGWRAWGRADETLRVRLGADWVIPPADHENLGGLGVNTTSDPVNRLSVASDASLFSHAGSDHRIKLNKAATANTATMLFQSGWSGRAEIGLAGDDTLSFKVSSDGAAWANALRLRHSDATAELGEVEVAGGIHLGGTLPVNRLSHYESDTFQPSLIDMSGNSVSLTPKRISFIRIGAQVTYFFNFMNNVSVAGLVASDDIAISLPFVNGSHGFSSVELQGPVGQAGPYHWYAQLGQSYAKIRTIAGNTTLKVSDFTSGVTAIIGGSLLVCLD